jgi:hypothetical protein
VLSTAREKSRIAVDQALAEMRIICKNDISRLIPANIQCTAIFAFEVLSQQRARVDGGQRLRAAALISAATGISARLALSCRYNCNTRWQGGRRQADIATVAEAMFRKK